MCGGDKLSILTSLNVKICLECHHEMPWKLDKGQKSLLIEGMVGEEVLETLGTKPGRKSE
jgi:hypothetical protein